MCAMSFTPSEEQQMLIDAIAKYAINDMRRVAHDADEDSALPVDVVQRGWEIGVLPAGTPETYGGFGEYSAVTNALAAEEFAFGDLAVAMAVMAPGLVGLPVLLSGKEEQKQNILPRLGEQSLPPFSAAMIEPGIAFDVNAPKTTAKRENGRYILNGEKCYVPLAADAQTMIVYARDTESGTVDGYIVEKGAE